MRHMINLLVCTVMYIYHHLRIISGCGSVVPSDDVVDVDVDVVDVDVDVVDVDVDVDVVVISECKHL